MSETAKSWIGAALAFSIVFAVWHAATAWFGVSAHVLPSLPALAESARLGLVGGSLHEHIRFTLSATVVGILIGASAGFVVGVIVSEVHALERAMYPVVVGIQSVPKVAVAPLIIVYFGLGMASKVFTVALLAFFPLFVNTVAGFKTVDRDLVDLFRTLSASRAHVLLNLKLPAAAPFVFSSLKIAIVFGLIGCVTSEFIASTQGLGYIIKSRSGELDVSMMFVCILILSAFGALAIASLGGLERRLLFWTTPSLETDHTVR